MLSHLSRFSFLCILAVMYAAPAHSIPLIKMDQPQEQKEEQKKEQPREAPAQTESSPEEQAPPQPTIMRRESGGNGQTEEQRPPSRDQGERPAPMEPSMTGEEPPQEGMARRERPTEEPKARDTGKKHWFGLPDSSPDSSREKEKRPSNRFQNPPEEGISRQEGEESYSPPSRHTRGRHQQDQGEDSLSFEEDSRSSESLSDSELRQRIAKTERRLQSARVRGESPILQQLERDKAVLRQRMEENFGSHVTSKTFDDPSAADRQARSSLQDRTPAGRLEDADLRKRMERTRSLLAVEGISPFARRALQLRLNEDREALRGRISDRHGGEDFDREPHRGRETLSDLLRDDRPSRDLSERELERRIRRIDRALEGRDLSRSDRQTLEEMLASDRRFLRDRLGEERRERKNRGLNFNLIIANDSSYAERPPIYADEVDDQDLEEQLIAPPTRRIERRYSVDEIRSMPSLRNVMPGVEIDSIHFGFNESFLREEEVRNISRVGGIMERILSKNPDEVFIIEGHTDAIGSDRANLTLSLDRARAVKKALLQYFEIRSDNLEVVGYGERFLKIPTSMEEPENRRVTIRRITPLLKR